MVNSEGLRAFPQILQRPFVGLKTSLIDFKFIILFITDPHLPQTISIDGYDMVRTLNNVVDRIIEFVSRWIDEILNNNSKPDDQNPSTCSYLLQTSR
jgi:hypothetical protein